MKILLLGGTGTLSYDILSLSLKNGCRVTIINRGNNNKSVDEKVRILKADLSHVDEVESAVGKENFDVVVDFFSRTASDIERLFPIFANQCSQYIFISSACVYCRTAISHEPITEKTDKPNKDWSYNVHKYQAEEFLKQLSTNKKCFYTIVRPYITYNKKRIPFGIAPKYDYHRTIIERIKNGKPMFVWNGGSVLTTVTYSTDFAKGVVGLFLNARAKNEDFHITSEHYYTIKDVLLEIYKQLGETPQIIDCTIQDIVKDMPAFKDMLIGDRSLNAVFDNSKIKVAVPDITFDIDLPEGIRTVLNYYKNSNNYLYDYAYDAQIDRLLSHQGIKLKYIRYSGDNNGHKILYVIYRFMPFRLARKLVKVLHIK